VGARVIALRRSDHERGNQSLDMARLSLVTESGVRLVARRHVDFGRVYSCACLFS
jgi:hypothetical protein